MRVRYKVFNSLAYERLMQNCPKQLNVNDYTSKGTGEVIQFIKGGLFSSHKFIVCDDDTKLFIEVRIEDCIKIEDNK